MKHVSNMNIVIVGGNGAMGKLFHSLWLSQNHVVKCLDLSNWDEASELLTNTHLVVISVPVDTTVAVIGEVAKYLLPTTILADFTSIKVAPMDAMLKAHTGPVLGLHPMFGPTIISPDKQVIINCGGRYLDESSWIIEGFTSLGFKIVELSTLKHDEIMGFIQGLEHFNTFALGGFLRTYNVHPNDIFNISSPIYQAKLALMGRIFDQDPKLYADIIMSDTNRINLIEKYVDYLDTWVKELKNSNKEKFIQDFEETSKWMGKFTHDSQIASDKFLSEVNQIYQKK